MVEKPALFSRTNGKLTKWPEVFYLDFRDSGFLSYFIVGVPSFILETGKKFLVLSLATLIRTVNTQN